MLALALVDPAGAFDQVPVSTLEAFIDTVLQDSDGAFVRAAYEANLERATPETRDGRARQPRRHRPRHTRCGVHGDVRHRCAPRSCCGIPARCASSSTRANDSPMSLHAQVPDLDIVTIEGSSHWLMLDQPEQFALALKEFVDAQSVPQ